MARTARTATWTFCLEFQSPRISLLTLSAIKYRLEDILKADVDVVHGPLSPDSMLVIDTKVPLYEL